MIRFIWKNWRRRKESFVLSIIGAIIIGVGLTYLVGLSEVNQTTIVDELQQRWESSYDIVVRPEGSRSVTEQEDLLDPNYLSGIDGGITLEQYNTIKNIQNVEVAAPIAMIGYADYPLYLESFELEEDGIYRLTREELTDDGITQNIDSTNTYFPSGEWVEFVEQKLREKGPNYFIGFPYQNLTTMRSMLIAGIDPEQEAKLVGLDEAIVELGTSRYFSSNEEISHEPVFESDEIDEEDMAKITSFPVIVSNQAYAEKDVNYKIERLDIPFDRETASETLEKLEEEGGAKYLDTVEGETVETYHFTEQEIFSYLLNSISGIDYQTGEPVTEDYLQTGNPLQMSHLSMIYRPSALEYESVTSPYPERWPFSYQLKTFANEISGNHSFRKPNEFGFINGGGYPLIDPQWIGFYDPSQLEISKDPTNELPMETYRPNTAELVLDKNENPINPPEILKPTFDQFNFLSNPPAMLTTLEVAEILSGDEPISAIRVKVSGVFDLSEDSQSIIERVAREIEQETGLITDITLGSSPQPTLVNVPEVYGEEELGWFHQPWIKLGSSITIFREAKIGFSGLILSIMSVAVIYVWSTSLVSLLRRRKEFAVLLAIGWQPRQLGKLLLLESTILGIFVALLSWFILGLIYMSEGAIVDPVRFFLTGLFGFLVYLLGAVVPVSLAQNIMPYEAIQSGEISKSSKRFIRTKGILSMAFNHFIGKWKRSLLSIVAIALPTSLLTIFLFITFQLRGTLYTTFLGQYVALEVGPVHYAAIAVALIIAILTTAEITWQNIAERQEEIALLKAVGWKNSSVRFLVWIEGMLVGLFAALVGLLIAFLVMTSNLQQLPPKIILMILSTGLVPIIVGLLGSILPAERAVKISPVEGMGGRYFNRKTTRKMMFWLIALAVILLVVFVYTMVRVVQI